jgi:hypothetical protein
MDKMLTGAALMLLYVVIGAGELQLQVERRGESKKKREEMRKNRTMGTQKGRERNKR